MLGDVARSVANLMFMLIGIWMAHRLYSTDKARWKVFLAWATAFVVAGISATMLSVSFATGSLTHERISMFCGFCCIFVYVYLFPSVPFFQRVFTYFFVDTSMYMLVTLSRFLSVFLLGFFPAVSGDAGFLFLYILFAALFLYFFAKHWKEPMLCGLAVFYNQLKTLALFAFLCYVSMIFSVDPWGPLYTVTPYELLRVLCICMLAVCMYFIAFRTMEAIHTTMSKELEAKMLKVQIDLSERYYENMMGNIERIKAIRHDLNHHIKVMEAMCGDGKWEALQKYMKALQKEVPREKLPIYCEDYVANALLDYYAGECRHQGIQFDCTAQFPRDILKDKLKLCIILGNGLQNALEACGRMLESGCSPQGRYIRVKIRMRGGNLVIEIKNSFNGQVQIQDQRLKTVKKEPDHGIGLENMKSTVELYHGYCRTEFTGEEFTLSVLLNLDRQPGMEEE